MTENKNHKGNYTGTTNMQAKNQDMAFVNDTLEQPQRIKTPQGVPDPKNHKDEGV